MARKLSTGEIVGIGGLAIAVLTLAYQMKSDKEKKGGLIHVELPEDVSVEELEPYLEKLAELKDWSPDGKEPG